MAFPWQMATEFGFEWRFVADVYMRILVSNGHRPGSFQVRRFGSISVLQFIRCLDCDAEIEIDCPFDVDNQKYRVRGFNVEWESLRQPAA